MVTKKGEDKMNFETLLRKRNQQGEHLIGLEVKQRTMLKIWHKIDGLVYIACLIGLCCLANYIEHL